MSKKKSKIKLVKRQNAPNPLTLIAALMVAIALLVVISIIGAKSKGDPNAPADDDTKLTVVINEVGATNQKSIYDEQGDFGDFIELYNTTDEDIDMSGWYITDNSSKPHKYIVAEGTVIQAHSYMVIFADNKDMTDSFIHLNFSLSEGETLFIFSSSNSKVDSVTIPTVTKDGLSYGRDRDNIIKWVYYSVPTPGRENVTKPYDTPEEAACQKGGPLFISEALPASTLSTYSGEDFIELYNMTDETVDLTGWYLSDAAGNLHKWAFPEGTSIGPGQYKVIVANGKDGTVSGNLCCSFKLGKYNETLYLVWGNTIIDEMSWGVGRVNVSVGIISAEDTTLRYFTTPTPGSANSSTNYTGVSPQVFFSRETGFYEEAIEVEIYTFTEGARIYYTTDGSLPSEKSTLYTEPITVSENSCIRAVSYLEGDIRGEYATANYIIGRDMHTVPVIFVTVAPSDWSKIYTSSTDPYRPRVQANITLIEEDGTLGFNEEALISKHGNMSTLYAQKSLSVSFRESVGKSEINYRLFPEDETRVTSFKSFILRTSGNDWDDIKIKDGFLQTLGAQAMDLDYQGFRSCVVYVNGRYWGLYNIREKQNEDYLASYYGIDPDNVDIISFGHGVHAGSYAQYYKLTGFLSSHDLNKEENWNTVLQMVDIDNLIDSYLMHIYYGNFDTVNMKWWRERVDGAKWRWLTYDLDYALYLPNQNNLAIMTNPAGHGVNNYFSSVVLYNLMKSTTFRNMFLDKIEEYWKTIFNPDYMINYWYYLYDKIDEEIDENLARWKIPRSEFVAEMNECYDYICDRPAAFRKMMKNYFGLSQSELDERFPLPTVTVPRQDW